MNSKSKHYMSIAGASGILALLDAYYLGNIADACDSDSKNLPFYAGIALVVVFIIFVIAIPVGKSVKLVILLSAVKLALIIGLVATFTLMSFALCF